MTEYQKRVMSQSVHWVNGMSIHNQTDDECTPDFSCCHKDLFETDRAKRVKFFNTWNERNGFPPYTDS
jgi:hypothetical protein